MVNSALAPPETHIMCTPRPESAPTVPGALRFSASASDRKRSANPVIELDSDSPPAGFQKPKSTIKAHFVKPAKKFKQSKMWQGVSDPAASLELDVAIADFVLSRNYDFALVADEKFKRVLDVARRAPPSYKPPTPARVGGELLVKLYDVNWQQETERLLKDSRTYGISMYGDGATIQTFPKINA